MIVFIAQEEKDRTFTFLNSPIGSKLMTRAEYHPKTRRKVFLDPYWRNIEHYIKSESTRGDIFFRLELIYD